MGFALRGPCPLGRALAYRSAPDQLGPYAGDAAGQRLARNPLPRATRNYARRPYRQRAHSLFMRQR